VERLKADLPPIDEASDGTSPASAPPPPPVLSLESQVQILETAVGPSRGTRVRGLGGISAKLPQKRGPSSQSSSDGRSAELEAEVAQLRARQAAIEEQLQTERAERERERAELQRERAAERERERAERERERADFDSRVQAQIENALRMAGIQPPNLPPPDAS